MAKEVEIASFSSVTYDKDSDNVFVTFKVCDSNYKDFVMRWATRQDGRLIIRGDKLTIIEKGDASRAAI